MQSLHSADPRGRAPLPPDGRGPPRPQGKCTHYDDQRNADSSLLTFALWPPTPTYRTCPP